MDRLQDMLTYVKVVEHGSISAAADALQIAKSAVSRRLAELENRLGVQLLRRSQHAASISRQPTSYTRNWSSSGIWARQFCFFLYRFVRKKEVLGMVKEPAHVVCALQGPHTESRCISYNGFCFLNMTGSWNVQL